MKPSPTLVMLSFATLASCASPLERCLTTAHRQVTTLERAIVTANGNLTRGYAIHKSREPIVVAKHCADKRGRRYRCDDVEYHAVETPVAIDLAEERQRRDALREDLIAARADAQRHSNQCFNSLPEG